MNETSSEFVCEILYPDSILEHDFTYESLYPNTISTFGHNESQKENMNQKIDRLPHLPLQIILSHLKFKDILNLRKVPVFRALLLDYYKRESNQEELIKVGFLEILDDFIDRTNTD